MAVVADADDLDLETMRGLAREFNQSETTFVMRPTRSDADWRLRFFTTTGAEVYGAGHNSLGAWWWLAESGRLSGRTHAPAPTGFASAQTTHAQEIGERVLPVEIDWNGDHPASIGQSPPVFAAVHRDPAALAGALRIQPSELDERFKPQIVSTGAAHMMVAVRDRAAVDRVRPDVERLLPLLRALNGQGCYVFCVEATSPARAYARFFNPGVGISEDPATGSAAGPLACHLKTATLIVEQGYLMKRPSRIDVRVDGDRVRVAGQAVIVADGTIRI